MLLALSKRSDPLGEFTRDGSNAEFRAVGSIAQVDDPSSLDVTNYSNFKLKALSFSWEFKFVRSMFKSEVMDAQYDLLNEVSALIDKGGIILITTSEFGKLTLANMKSAHAKQESGKVIGKLALDVE